MVFKKVTQELLAKHDMNQRRQIRKNEVQRFAIRKLEKKIASLFEIDKEWVRIKKLEQDAKKLNYSQWNLNKDDLVMARQGDEHARRKFIILDVFDLDKNLIILVSLLTFKRFKILIM